MQAYSKSIAIAYERIWGEYGEEFGRKVLNRFAERRATEPNLALDLACGTGSVARVFLANGLRVVGIDGSSDMLTQAEAGLRPDVDAGLATFIQGDLRNFQLDKPVDIATVCYDAINHLESTSDLERCFACAAGALKPGGALAFDLATIRGLSDWDGVKIKAREDYEMHYQGFFDRSSRRAWKKLSGFYAVEAGLYERFEQVIFNTGFPIEEVVAALALAGFADIEVCDEDLLRPHDDPESLDRVVILARLEPRS